MKETGSHVLPASLHFVNSMFFVGVKLENHEKFPHESLYLCPRNLARSHGVLIKKGKKYEKD